jgi:NNP family nitrate/nitrite transporter-like MFS transporter
LLRLVFLLTGATTLFIGFASSLWVEVAIFMQPLLAVCFFPAGLAALSMVSSSEQRNIMVSLTVPFAFLIGGGGAPTLIGFFGDLGSFGGGIALVGGAITTGAVLTGFLRFKEDK